MNSVGLAMAAIFSKLNSIRIILFIFHCGIVTALAFSARQSYAYSQNCHLLEGTKKPISWITNLI